MKTHASQIGNTHLEIAALDCDLPGDELTHIQDDLTLLAQNLAEFPTSELYLRIVHHPRSERYHVQAKLKLPGKTIVTGHYSPWLDEALNRCLGKIRRRVDGYKNEAPRDAIAAAEQRKELADVVAPMEPDAGELGAAVERQDFAAFRRLLAGYESQLRTEVAHRTLGDARIAPMIGWELDNDDIVEDVYLTAFEHFAEKPDQTTIGQWLVDFIEPSMQALAGDPDEREAASFARTLSSPGANETT
jgi:hypothetical protein